MVRWDGANAPMQCSMVDVWCYSDALMCHAVMWICHIVMQIVSGVIAPDYFCDAAPRPT